MEGIAPERPESVYTLRTIDKQQPYLAVPAEISDVEDSQALMGVPIEAISIAQDLSDIAIVRVDLSGFTIPPRAQFKFPLTMAEPNVGETCMALGYADMAPGEQLPDHPNGMHGIGFYAPLHASQAIIEEVHASGRDSAMLPFPCFRTSAYFAPGMSGGPIISNSGRVTGIVSAGYGREQRTAYGAIMAGIIRNGARLLDDHGVDFDLVDLVKHGLVDTDVAVNWTDGGLEWPVPS